MSDAPRTPPLDANMPVVGRSPRQRMLLRPAETTLGNVGDQAINLPGAPGQPTGYEEVLIAPPPTLDDTRLQDILTREFREAQRYDDRLIIARSQSMRLYNGEALGDEEPGRSQIVLTEIKDSINAMMPSMMRIFAGADLPVVFLPRRDGDEDQAQQAQDYVQHVVFTENDGWRALHDAIMGALQLKSGWIKWWWDYQAETKTEHYYSMLEGQAAALLSEPGVTAMRVVRRPATPRERAGILASPEAQITPIRRDTQLLVYDAQISRKIPRNRPRLLAIPPEQVLIDPDASGPQDPCLRFLGIWRIVTVSELVALGFPKELVETRVTQMTQQLNRVTRRRDRLAATIPRSLSPDPALRMVRYLECWMRADVDGDGVAELHHLHAIGDYSFLLLAHEPVARVNVARLAPFPVPHKAIGESMADRIADIQKALTRVFRNILDSMAESIHPRTCVQEGMANVDDIMNTEMGAVIREKAPGAVRELTKPFIGPQALPLMETLTAIKEQRTGVSRTSQGLTPEVLQSTTAIAVGAQIMASADRLELVIRCIAEGVRDVYDGMLALLCEHQDRSRVVLLRGRWVPVDPRSWMAGFHVQVRVGIGHGTQLERIQVLGSIAGQQREALQTMGPNNPVCTLGQLTNTLSDMMRAAGIQNTGRYINTLPTNFQFQPPPPPPTPDQVLANAEAMKAQADAQNAALKISTDRTQALLEDDRLRDEARVKAILEGLEIQSKYGTRVDIPSLAALLNRNPYSEASLALSGAGAPGGTPGAAAPGAPSQPPPPGAASPGPAGAMPPPGGGLAQRLFLPPPLIAALAAANRPASLAPTLPAPTPAMMR